MLGFPAADVAKAAERATELRTLMEGFAVGEHTGAVSVAAIAFDRAHDVLTSLREAERASCVWQVPRRSRDLRVLPLDRIACSRNT